MSHTNAAGRERSQGYEIRIKGHLRDRWAAHFEGMTITREEHGGTLLSGPVADQAALHGLLKKVRDVGMPLISVQCVDPDQADGSNAEQLRGEEQ